MKKLLALFFLVASSAHARERIEQTYGGTIPGSTTTVITPISVKVDGVVISTPANVINFDGDDFVVTDSPAGQANVSARSTASATSSFPYGLSASTISAGDVTVSSLNKSYYVSALATGGSGTEADPYTGWCSEIQTQQAASENGASFFFDADTVFQVTSSCTIDLSDKRLTVLGTASSKVECAMTDGTDCLIFVGDGGADANDLYDDHFYMDGLWVQGNASAGTSLVFRGVTYPKISNLWVEDSGNDGVEFDQILEGAMVENLTVVNSDASGIIISKELDVFGTHDFVIDGAELEGNNIGLELEIGSSWTQIIVQNSLFDDNAGAAISINDSVDDAFTAAALQILGNQFDGNNGSTGAQIVSSEAILQINLTIANNHFFGPALDMTWGAVTSIGNTVNISGNNIVVASAGTYDAINFDSNAATNRSVNANIVGNTFRQTATTIDATAIRLTDVQVLNIASNDFQNMENAIVMSDVGFVNVASNKFTNTRQNPLLLTTAVNVAISGNFSFGNGLEAAQPFIELAGSVTEASITGNNSDGGSTGSYFLEISGASNNQILARGNYSAGNATGDVTGWTMSSRSPQNFCDENYCEGAIYVSTQATIASDGTSAAATLTLTPLRDYVQLYCHDTDGCNVTMGEVNIATGTIVEIVNVSTNAINFADTAGVSELAGAFVAGQWDAITMRYAVNTWSEISRNVGSFLQVSGSTMTFSSGIINASRLSVSSNTLIANATFYPMSNNTTQLRMAATGTAAGFYMRSWGAKSSEYYSGAFAIDATSSTGHIMKIYHTGLDDVADDTTLLRLTTTNPDYEGYYLRIDSETDLSNPEIRIDSPNPDIEFKEIDEDIANGKGAYEITIQDDDFKIAGRNAANTSYEDVVVITDHDHADGVALTLVSSTTLRIAEKDGGGSYRGFSASHTYTGSGTWQLPSSLNNSGQVLFQEKDGAERNWVFTSGGSDGQVLTKSGTTPTWTTIAGSGDVVTTATQTLSGANTFTSSNSFNVVSITSGTVSAFTATSATVTVMNVSSITVNTIAVATMTRWAAYTPTVTGFGTISDSQFIWRRIDDMVYVRGVFRAGTTTLEIASVTVPSGTSIKYGATAMRDEIVGMNHHARAEHVITNDTVLIFVDAIETNRVFFTSQGVAGSGWTKSTGASVSNSGDYQFLTFMFITN